jgi:hypothetical protein
VLSRRELNRALLARQLLLERGRVPVPRALERVAGLQAQDPRAPYIGLWTRLDGFDRAQLTRAIRRRHAVKATLMRATVHLTSARDYVLFLPAVLPMLREYWRRYESRRSDVGDRGALANRAVAFASAPRSASELGEHLGGELGWWRARLHAPFVHAPTGDDWAFGRRPAFVAAETWLRRPFGATEGGLRHLVRRYLAAFGPATAADAAAWSGLPVSALRPAFDALDLRRFCDERGHELLDLRRTPLPPAGTPAPPRLLPPFDNLVLSHADRTRVISDEHRRTVIRAGIVDPVFLVDGFVAGRWRLRRGRIELEPFEPLPGAARAELVREAETLTGWLR